MPNVDRARLAAKLVKNPSAGAPELRFGVVSSVNYAAIPWTVGVLLSGGDRETTDVPTINSYCPRVDDVVVCAKSGGDLWVIGSFTDDTSPRCSVDVGGQSIPSGGGTTTDTVFAGVEFDSDDMWDPLTPDRIHIRTDGVYRFDAQAEWANAIGGRRLSMILLNSVFGWVGEHDVADVAGAGESKYAVVARPRWYAAGDYIRVGHFQSSPTNPLGCTTILTATWLKQR